MRRPALFENILDAGLRPEVCRTFLGGLVEVAGGDAALNDDQRALLRKFKEVLSPAEEAAPFESLWPHAELFLRSCLYMAVIDGQYDIEEARRVSSFAQRLGLSVRQLSVLEGKVFSELKRRSRGDSQKRAPERPHAGMPVFTRSAQLNTDATESFPGWYDNEVTEVGKHRD